MKLKKHLSTTIKITISAVLIWLIFRKLDWILVGQLLKTSNIFYLSLAIIFFVFSQFISIFRFNIFIRKIGIRLNLKTNARLYLLGMFYNFFLPGAVGGDAYKVYLLNKSHKKSIKRIGEVIFIERLIGVLAIGFLGSILIFFVQLPVAPNLNFGLCVLGILLTGFALKWIIRYLHSYKKRVHIVFFYSLLVQMSQLFSVLFILKSFNVEGYYIIYLLLFLISSVLSVISFAGIGIREAVFYYGAQWYDFNPDVSASVALTFSIFTAIISFSGIVYMVKGVQLADTENTTQ